MMVTREAGRAPDRGWPARTVRNLSVVAILALVAAACSGTGPAASPVPSISSTTVAARSGDSSEVVLLAGSVEVSGAQAFGDPGFHTAFVLAGVVPEAGGGAIGDLTVRLRDAGRPTRTCERDHPLSGCVTVDWSDFEDRPGVPPGGVFDNRLAVQSTAGPVDLFLSESRGLALEPDEYSPA